MIGMALELKGVERGWQSASGEVRPLRGIDFSVEPGERVAILGPSGSGKSTLLQIMGLLDTPSAGTVYFDGREVSTLREAERDHLRNREVGFVFQKSHLLDEHTALSNVSLPVLLAGGSASTARTRAETVLRAVGLGDRLHHHPGKLSGGEAQRVALARALVMGPRLVLADEPTGNLDPDTASGVFDLLLDLHNTLGTTLVVVTHSHTIASRFPRRYQVSDGRLMEAN